MRTLGVGFALAVSPLHCGGVPIAAAQDVSSPLTVEEAKLRFHLLPQPVLELPVLNSTNKSIPGKFRLSLLNYDDDSVAAAISGAFIETPGETVEKIAWPLEHLPSDTPTQLGWYRLQYSLEPEAESGMPPARGVVQLGPLLTDGFGISIAAAAKVAPGSKYPVRLH
ncbi:MAG: hypothetical protein WBA09_05790, partial [Candidatus Acidiferrum sp.]